MNGKIGLVVYIVCFLWSTLFKLSVEFLLEKIRVSNQKGFFLRLVPYFILKINIKSVFVNRTVQDTHV